MPHLSEFDLIAKFFAPLATSPGAFGLKDDAAVIAPRAGFDLVVTTDTIVEGVDFFADDPPGSIAKKALRVNLSDLAAKGAEPHAYLLALSLSAAIEQCWLEDFARGLGEDQKHYAIDLLGGDISSTPGPLTISVTAFGHVPKGRMIRRNGARIGMMPSSSPAPIGDSGGGLALLKASKRNGLSAAQRNWSARYRVPEPPVTFWAEALRGLVSAALDVSSGWIARRSRATSPMASGVRIVVEAASIPRSDSRFTRRSGETAEDAIVRAATSGDDYQIAFTRSACRRRVSRVSSPRRATRISPARADRPGRKRCGRRSA